MATSADLRGHATPMHGGRFSLQEVLAHIDGRRQQFEADLFELLRIASVSADPAFAPQVREAAAWVQKGLANIGLKAELIETDGHPIVYAESPPVPGAPVALVYGHYDVQPPDPLDEWTTPPFEPTVRDGKVFARGATDDKGQMLTHVKSVESWLAAVGKLPLQVKFLIEGEEEVGSEHLSPFLRQNAQRLACDCVVISEPEGSRSDAPSCKLLFEPTLTVGIACEVPAFRAVPLSTSVPPLAAVESGPLKVWFPVSVSVPVPRFMKPTLFVVPPPDVRNPPITPL